MRKSKIVDLDKFLKERLIAVVIGSIIMGIIEPIIIKIEGELLSSSIISLLCIYGAIIKLPQKYLNKLSIKLAIYIPIYILLIYVFTLPLIFINIKCFIIIDLVFSAALGIVYFNRQQLFNEILKNNYEDFNLHNFSNEQNTFIAVGAIIGYLLNIIVTHYFNNDIILFVTMLLSYSQLYWMFKFNRYIITIYNNSNISDKS